MLVDLSLVWRVELTRPEGLREVPAVAMSDPKTVEARVRSQIIMIEPIEGAPYVVATFDIDCPFCGEQRIEIAGHHMRLIRDVLIQAIDQYPELTQIFGTKVIDQIFISGPGNNPSTS